MNMNYSTERHSPGRSILLHLLPGLLIGASYFVLRPILNEWGYPSIMALMCAVFLVLVPFELGYLLYEGRKRNGYFSLQGVVLYRTRIPVWQYLLWVPVLFILLALIFTLMKPVDAFLRQQFFAWLPVLESGLQAGYSREALIGTYVMVAIFGVVVGPLVEEFYFRGYLLPRMVYAGKWAPLLNSFLFALYHVWTPWMFLTRTLGALVLAYAAQRRSLYLSIAVHILVNSVDLITGIAFISAMSNPG
jgi:membrane protease YdiL (CAAX protease family)